MITNLINNKLNKQQKILMATSQTFHTLCVHVCVCVCDCERERVCVCVDLKSQLLQTTTTLQEAKLEKEREDSLLNDTL